MTTIAAIPALRDLPAAVLAEIGAGSREVRWRAGAVIRPAGETARGVVLLVSGTVAAVEGEVWTEHWDGPAIVDKAAVLSGGPQAVGLVAVTAVVGRLLPGERFLDLLAASGPVREHVLRRLARDVTAGRELAAQRAVQPAVARVAGWLLGRSVDGPVVWRGSQEQLGRLLGLSRVTVNRALGRLARAGAVRLTGRGVVVADPALLLQARRRARA
jgi:CRP/FNR family cyclic AMP-dependent transcriptional regulator